MTLDGLLDRCCPEPNTGCWLWTGARYVGGYGSVKFGGKSHRVHRLVAAMCGHNIDGLEVMHKCDTPPCCNPDHPTVGTHKENMLDCAGKGRTGGDRVTHCRRAAHELTTDNTYVDHAGRRRCRTCLHNDYPTRKAA